jgi:hypothetical protein
MSERVRKMGNAGDSPARVSDPPTGTVESNFAKRSSPFTSLHCLPDALG